MLKTPCINCRVCRGPYRAKQGYLLHARAETSRACASSLHTRRLELRWPSTIRKTTVTSTVFTNLRYPLRKVTSLADRPIVQLLLDRPLPLMLPTAA